jgi:hypothetical protein
MVERSRQDPACDVMDLFVTAAAAYPYAAASVVGYWAEVVASASTYHADVVEACVEAWRRPAEAGAALSGLAARFKEHAARCGDITERAVLEFNQRLEAALRPAATSRAAAGDSPHDLASLRQDVEKLLDALRRLEHDPGGARPDAPPSPAMPV